MPELTFTFKRTEKKYLLTEEQVSALFSLIGDRLCPDAYGKSTVANIYLDTPDFRLIRTSIEARTYKEKLRIRAYGTPTADSPVFFELKKKYKGVVYKRREKMTLAEAQCYIETGRAPCESQIMRELDYAMCLYKPSPAVVLCYDREAFYEKDDSALRFTFDRNIRYRRDSLSLASGTDGRLILQAPYVLMELKTPGAVPMWLCRALDACRITPVSFSKYGTAYKDLLSQKNTDTEPAVNVPLPHSEIKGEKLYV